MAVAGLWFHPPISPARGPPTDWGELVQPHDDRNVFQATDRRAARDRYPQPLTPAERQVTGHNKAVRRPDSERLRADAGKTSLQRGKQAFREPVLGPARREHAAHESLSIRPMLAEVPLAGLSSRGGPNRHTACRSRRLRSGLLWDSSSYRPTARSVSALRTRSRNSAR